MLGFYNVNFPSSCEFPLIFLQKSLFYVSSPSGGPLTAPQRGPPQRGLFSRADLAPLARLGLGSAGFALGFRLASLRLSAGLWLGFRLDFGWIWIWLSFTRMWIGFDLNRLDFGWI